MSDYYVDKRRNHDGVSNWCFVLWIDDCAWDSYATEAEAWAAAEQHHAEKHLARAATMNEELAKVLTQADAVIAFQNQILAPKTK